MFDGLRLQSLRQDQFQIRELAGFNVFPQLRVYGKFCERTGGVPCGSFPVGGAVLAVA